MVAIEKLIKGNEIDLKELEQRINQAQIQKVGAGWTRIRDGDLASFIYNEL